jgi:phosphotransferase system HPr (HPr) family protein
VAVKQASSTVTVVNELGLHTRAASILVRTAKRFKSKIFVSNGEARAEATGILDILTLGATRGTRLTIEAEGPDAPKAVAALEALIKRSFAE